MTYATSQKAFTFSKNHQIFVAPLISQLPTPDDPAPLSFLVEHQFVSRCVYAWRNWLNFQGLKPSYRVSVINLRNSITHKGIQIDYIPPAQEVPLPIAAARRPCSSEEIVPSIASLTENPPGAGDTFLPDGKAPEFTTKKFWEDAIQEVLQADACSDADATSPTTECRSPFDPATKK